MNECCRKTAKKFLLACITGTRKKRIRLLLEHLKPNKRINAKDLRQRCGYNRCSDWRFSSDISYLRKYLKSIDMELWHFRMSGMNWIYVVVDKSTFKNINRINFR